jgi:hypothetical protein
LFAIGYALAVVFAALTDAPLPAGRGAESVRRFVPKALLAVVALGVAGLIWLIAEESSAPAAALLYAASGLAIAVSLACLLWTAQPGGEQRDRPGTR